MTLREILGKREQVPKEGVGQMRRFGLGVWLLLATALIQIPFAAARGSDPVSITVYYPSYPPGVEYEGKTRLTPLRVYVDRSMSMEDRVRLSLEMAKLPPHPWLTTAFPRNLQVLDVRFGNAVCDINFSSHVDEIAGGGKAIEFRDQLAWTLPSTPDVARYTFRVDGVPREFLTAEGIFVGELSRDPSKAVDCTLQGRPAREGRWLTVYYLGELKSGTSVALVPCSMLVDLSLQAEAAVRVAFEMLKCPPHGALGSAIPESAELLYARIAGSVLTLDLSSEAVCAFEGVQPERIVAQLLWTMLEIPGLDLLVITVNGRPPGILGGQQHDGGLGKEAVPAQVVPLPAVD